jgi:Leucine-rich repeat (LRR) protein
MKTSELESGETQTSDEKDIRNLFKEALKSDLNIIADLEDEINVALKLEQRAIDEFSIRFNDEPTYRMDTEKNIIGLSLTELDLKEIPKVLFNLKHLKELYLDDNLIEEIPETIGKLTKLKDLTLSNNNLKELPDSIGNLTKLVDLNLINNSIRNLPRTFVKLKKLNEVFLDDNQFKQYPDEINKLPLAEFHLDGNPCFEDKNL